MHIFLFDLKKYSNLKNLKSICGKKDAFDCAGIRAQVFRLIENPKFNLITIIFELRKKRKNAKLFASIRFTNFDKLYILLDSGKNFELS